MSDIRFNQWLHQSGTGGVTQLSSGHVGIGTTNPLIPVHSGNNAVLNVGVVTANNIYAGTLNGTLALSDISGITGSFTSDLTVNGPNLDISDKIRHIGDTNTAIRFPANDTISFETGSSEKFRIGSDGQIGLSGTNYGTAGQVLTSQGSGSAVQWASPVIYTEYSSQTLSGANSYATTITGNPKIFEVSLYKLRTVASQNTMYRLSTSAGEITSGYHDISYAVRAGNSNISNAVRGSAQGQGCLTNYDFTNPDNLISGEARFTRVAAGLYTWQAMYDHRFDPSRSGGDANDQYLLNSKGHIADFSSSGSGIVTQFRIFTSGGGNFTSGTVTVRGIA